jgi:hypothetical protein
MAKTFYAPPPPPPPPPTLSKTYGIDQWVLILCLSGKRKILICRKEMYVVVKQILVEVSITGVVEGGFHAWGLVRLLSRHYQDNKL